MGGFSTFFRESDKSLGVFYPRHYIIATFPTYTAAKGAHQALRNAGHSDEEVLLATGEEVLEYFQHFREDAGLWGIVMRYLSRLLASEVAFADKDIEHAQEGSGFLAIYSRTDQDAAKIVNTAKPFAPSSMEWYLAGGIRSLV